MFDVFIPFKVMINKRSKQFCFIYTVNIRSTSALSKEWAVANCCAEIIIPFVLLGFRTRLASLDHLSSLSIVAFIEKKAISEINWLAVYVKSCVIGVLMAS